MDVKEAKEVIRRHLCKPTSNTKELIDAIETATEVLGPEATIDDVCEWAQN